MGAHYVCDYCGETIEDREHASVYGIGGRGYFSHREYHASPCLGLVNDILENATGTKPVSEKQMWDRDLAEWRANQAKWHALSLPQREHLLVELLGDRRMPVAGFVAKVEEAFGKCAVSYGDVYPVLRRLRQSGELGGVAEPFRGTRTRTVYFRREMAGPIVDLDRAFNEPSGEES